MVGNMLRGVWEWWLSYVFAKPPIQWATGKDHHIWLPYPLREGITNGASRTSPLSLPGLCFLLVGNVGPSIFCNRWHSSFSSDGTGAPSSVCSWTLCSCKRILLLCCHAKTLTAPAEIWSWFRPFVQFFFLDGWFSICCFDILLGEPQLLPLDYW